MRVTSLYIHIPFCLRKCKYCDFISLPLAGRESVAADYLHLVEQELALYAGKADLSRLQTIYFGGGTPSLMQPAAVADLLQQLPAVQEITLEANPETLNAENLRQFRAAGINRLSLGVQCFDDDALQAMGRGHSSEQALQAVQMASQAGFDNIGIDLIYGLPGQSIADWRKQVEQAISLPVQHISLYSLTLEQGTPWFEAVAQGELTIADEDLSADMLELAIELLPQAGFAHYEISNFARAGFESSHNTAYWQRENYLGLGVAAAGCFANHRFSNTLSLEEYAEKLANAELPIAKEEFLDMDDVLAEAVFLGLRLIEGINFERFAAQYGIDPRKRFKPQIRHLTAAGLLICDEQGMRLSERGLMLGNQVFMEFV